MFEKATREKLRFDTQVGPLSVEDLWDLSLTSEKKVNLNDIAKVLFKQLENGDDVSFVDTAKKTDKTVQLRFDIVKHIIDVKLAENTEKVAARGKAERLDKINQAIARRQDLNLENLSLEELEAAKADLTT
ncbi:hypothetical protein [Bradyrhizobium ottawaense]|uniref:Uncharacterized protein n=1 Tax=Bradyrhizobium ottawaense TaxID=931866 RepID=A0ABY0QHD8_9BRAD|nr:hypothetical protein [Bradyrhizobium ottawaense]SDK44658.1 hypothetical protein SAMN05444163_8131 [Bradyrhizobium ottawaense]